LIETHGRASLHYCQKEKGILGNVIVIKEKINTTRYNRSVAGL